MSIRDELDFINGIEFSEKNKIISEQIVKEIKNRLQFLLDVGLRLFKFIKKFRNFIWWRISKNKTCNSNRIITYGSFIYFR